MKDRRPSLEGGSAFCDGFFCKGTKHRCPPSWTWASLLSFPKKHLVGQQASAGGGRKGGNFQLYLSSRAVVSGSISLPQWISSSWKGKKGAEGQRGSGRHASTLEEVFLSLPRVTWSSIITLACRAGKKRWQRAGMCSEANNVSFSVAI